MNLATGDAFTFCQIGVNKVKHNFFLLMKHKGLAKPTFV